jgi:Cu2+-exporting ATPase
MSQSCFHCQEPVPEGLSYSFEWKGETRHFCCIGCQAAARWIIDQGLDEYYERRTEAAPTSTPVDDQEAALMAAYDNGGVRQSRLRRKDNLEELWLHIEGISCAACVWILEKTLSQLDGVAAVQINAVTRKAAVSLLPDSVAIADILAAIRRLGFRPHVVCTLDEENSAEHKDLLKRIGVAGLGAMQTMMFATGLYFGDAGDIAVQYRDLLHWVSLLVATVVVGYSAQPFFRGALRSIRARHLGMDVPIALAIASAWGLSALHIVLGQGEIYLDSATMFTFFLLIGRYLLARAQARAATAVKPLDNLPDVVLLDDGKTWKPIESVVPGDVIRVPQHSVVPVDGALVDDTAYVDEAMLTGESTPILRRKGEPILAGTRMLHGTARITAEAVGEECYLHTLTELQSQAIHCRDQRDPLADRIARYFTLSVLLMAGITGLGWWLASSEWLLSPVLAVLVVSCPCALSLAMPAALTSALARASEQGLLVKEASALLRLPDITTCIFDKTGTLTTGRLRVARRTVHGTTWADSELAGLALALQAGSEHPVAKAIVKFHLEQDDRPSEPDIRVEELPHGRGRQASWAGQTWTIATSRDGSGHGLLSREVVLSCNGDPVVCYTLEDEWRPDALDVVQALHQFGLRTALLTGDSAATPGQLQEATKVHEVETSFTPEDKLAWLQGIQAKGQRALMVGDGLNDAPILAQADVSLAIAAGAQLSQRAADAILAGDRLQPMLFFIQLAQQTRHVVRQNYLWALMYNAISIPAAAMGYLSPWMAAIGMSASSLLVVVNALRLRRWSAGHWKRGERT